MGINGLKRATPRRRRLSAAGGLAVGATALCVLAGPTAGALAKGGTAKPPPGGTASFTIPTLTTPTFSVGADQIHGFDETGYIQSATVSGASCPAGQTTNLGGTVTINGNTITIPCNTIVQMPANTLSWDDFVGDPAADEVKSFPSGTSFNSLNTYAAFELHVIGNFVGGKRIGALAFASQQSTNSGSGVITKIDYADGRLHISGSAPAAAGASDAVVEINDPKITDPADPANGTGRFSAGQSPDARYSVDQENPTVHAGTGYPMCIPRTDPGTTDDPLCPQVNRPKPAGATATAAGHCRNFADDGANVGALASGDISQPSVGQTYCSQFVMPAAGTANAPDPKQQAPLEVGDFVTYAGTLQHDGGGDYISANTIEANVGIYTHHNSQPAYMAIGEFGVGTADPNAVAPGGVVNQETQDRLFLESETTDPFSGVDIYMVDTDSQTGNVSNRWVTTPEMTGALVSSSNPTGGGIFTMTAGPQPQRARIRANKAPTGLLSQPTRTIRVVQRSLCTPTTPDTTNDPSTNELHSKTTSTDVNACLAKAASTPVANGLVAGQYQAPTFEYIFPENVRPGDPVVPNDLWHLGFLRFGEGPGNEGALSPLPW
jgi:hypothetical protein